MGVRPPPPPGGGGTFVGPAFGGDHRGTLGGGGVPAKPPPPPPPSNTPLGIPLLNPDFIVFSNQKFLIGKFFLIENFFFDWKKIRFSKETLMEATVGTHTLGSQRPPPPPSLQIGRAAGGADCQRCPSQHRGAAARMPARGGGLLSLGFTRQVQPSGGGDAQPPAAAPAGADGGAHSPRSGQGRSSEGPTWDGGPGPSVVPAISPPFWAIGVDAP